MIKITDKWYLDSDKYQFIICEKKIAQKGENIGNEYYDQVAFCGNLFQVKSWLMNEEIRADLELLNNIDKCIRLSNSINQALGEAE